MSRLSQQPHPLIDTFVPVIGAWSLVAAITNGVFDAIDGGMHQADEIASHIGADQAGVERLLSHLAAMGYVMCTDEGYHLSEIAKATLTERSPFCLTNWTRFSAFQIRSMEGITESVSKGRRVNLFDFFESSRDIRTYQLAMAETAMPIADWVAQSIPVPDGATHLLDVGGSHGLYSAAVCRENPAIMAEILELPSTIEEARAVAEIFGSADLVNHLEGDILETELPRRYGMVFLANVVHHFTQDQL